MTPSWARRELPGVTNGGIQFQFFPHMPLPMVAIEDYHDRPAHVIHHPFDLAECLVRNRTAHEKVDP